MGRWRGRETGAERIGWTRRRGWLAAIASFGAAPEARGAFLLEEGATQAIQSSSVSRFSRGYDPKGRLIRSGSFSKTSLDAHLSHGLNPDVTLMAVLSTDRLSPDIIGDPGGSSALSGMAGARVRLWRDDSWTVSAQILAGAGREGPEGFAGAGGRAGFMGEARLLVGRSFTLGGVDGFADLQAGWRRGAPGARDELRLDGTLGLKPHPRLTTLAQIFAAQGFSGSGLGGAGLAATSRVKGQLSLVWQATPAWSVQAGAFVTLAGRNAAQENGAVLALWRRF